MTEIDSTVIAIYKHFTCNICNKVVSTIHCDESNDITNDDKVMIGMLMASHASINHSMSSFSREEITSMFNCVDDCT